MRGLTRLAQLGTMARLARLSLAHNHLTSAAGLGACFALETLDLSNNCLSGIGTAALQHCMQQDSLGRCYKVSYRRRCWS